MWARCVPWIYMYYSTTMWVNKLIKILGYGEIQFEKPQVWLFDDHLGNAGEMGKYGFNGREAPELSFACCDWMSCTFLEFLFRFLLGFQEKMVLVPWTLPTSPWNPIWWWTSRSEGIPFWKLPSGGFKCPALGFQVSCKTRDQSIGNGLVGLCGAELYLGLKRFFWLFSPGVL